MHYLCKVCTLLPLIIGLGFTRAATILDWHAIFAKTMTVTRVVALEWPLMLFALDTMLISPAGLLGLLWNPGVN